MPRASSCSASHTAFRPHAAAGFGHPREGHCIYPPDCRLAFASTCRAQAAVQFLGSCPCAATGGPEGIGPPGPVRQERSPSPHRASMTLRVFGLQHLPASKAACWRLPMTKPRALCLSRLRLSTDTGHGLMPGHQGGGQRVMHSVKPSLVAGWL